MHYTNNLFIHEIGYAINDIFVILSQQLHHSGGRRGGTKPHPLKITPKNISIVLGNIDVQLTLHMPNNRIVLWF